MASLKHRIERIERQLKMSATAPVDRRACPKCRAHDDFCAKVGIQNFVWPPVCHGHPEQTPEQAQAASERLRFKLFGK